MMITVEMVCKTIMDYHMVESGDRVIIGVSGGADSMCLLFLMSEIKDIMGFSLSAVHVHHGIRGRSADEDRDYVEKECALLNIPCETVMEKVPEYALENGLSEEEAGRILRYRAFRKNRPDRIAVAHHAEDSAETTLFNLFRGTGLKGLSGIRPVSGDIIRPLIFYTRKEIEDYCREKGIEYRNDETNRDDNYARNRIRHSIIPEAEIINKGAAKHILEASEKIRQAWEYIDAETDRIFHDCADLSAMPGKLMLDAGKLAAENSFIRSVVIKKCIAFLAGREKDLTAVHVSDTDSLLSGISGKKLSLPYGITAEKSFDSLIFYKKMGQEDRGSEEIRNEIPFNVIPEGPAIQVLLPDGAMARGSVSDNDMKPDAEIKNLRYTKWLDYDKIKGNAVWRTRRPGDRISIQGGSKKLKDLLIEARVPVEERNSLCLLAVGNEVIWVPGLRIGHMFKVTAQTKRILQVSLDLDED